MEFYLIYGITLTGAIVQGAVGFGYGLVAAPVLMLLQPTLVPGPISVSGLLLSGSMAIQERKFIHYHDLVWLCAGQIPGIAVGAFLMHILSARTLAFLFGFLVLTAVGLSLQCFSIKQRSHLMIFVAGLLSGIMNITTAMGGPPVALLYQNEAGPKFRGTLALYFFIGSLLTLVGLHHIDRMGEQGWRDGLHLMPMVLLGVILAKPAARWLDRGKTRQAVLTLAALSGLTVILKAAWLTG